MFVMAHRLRSILSTSHPVDILGKQEPPPQSSLAPSPSLNPTAPLLPSRAHDSSPQLRPFLLLTDQTRAVAPTVESRKKQKYILKLYECEEIRRKKSYVE